MYVQIRHTILKKNKKERYLAKGTKGKWIPTISVFGYVNGRQI